MRNRQSFVQGAMILTAAGIISKLLGAGLACWSESWKTRLQTGVCMIPRGEVGIIVGLIGLSLHTMSRELYTIVIGMSLVTTIITPPLINRVFRDSSA